MLILYRGQMLRLRYAPLSMTYRVGVLRVRSIRKARCKLRNRIVSLALTAPSRHVELSRDIWLRMIIGLDLGQDFFAAACLWQSFGRNDIVF